MICESLEGTYHRILFPEPATKEAALQFMGVIEKKAREVHTLPVNPQQGTGHLPSLKFAASTEPLGCPLVLTVGCEVVVCGRVGRRLPISKVFKQLAPCDRLRDSIAAENGSDDERLASSTFFSTTFTFSSTPTTFSSTPVTWAQTPCTFSSTPSTF